MTKNEEDELADLLAVITARKPQTEIAKLLVDRRNIIIKGVVDRRSPLKYAIRTTMLSTLDVVLHRASNEEKERVRQLVISTLISMSNTAERLVKNEMAKFGNDDTSKQNAILRYASSAVIDLAGVSNLLVQWVTRADEAVCSLCSPLDGKVFMPHEMPELPFHSKCRCGFIVIAGYLPTRQTKLLNAGQM